MLPSACAWLDGHIGHRQSYYQKTMQSAVRSRDPFQKIMGTWLIRRLSPESNPIEIADLPAERDEETLLYAMGSEAANVHLGSKRQVAHIFERPETQKIKLVALCRQRYGPSHRKRLEEVQETLDSNSP